MRKLLGTIILVLITIAIIAGIYMKQDNIKTDKNTNQTAIQATEQKEEKDSQKLLESEKKYSMTNGGRFAKVGDIAVYCDFENNIYKFNLKEKTGEKVYTPEDGLGYMYFDGENIYYMPYYYRGRGIYKLSLDGSAQKIYDGASLQLVLTDEKIYFIKQIGYDDMNQKPQGDLCVMNKDGSGVTTLISNVRNYFRIENNKIYYTDNNTKGVFVAGIDGQNSQELATGRTLIMDVNSSSLTYIDYASGESLGLVDLNSGNVKILGRFGGSLKTEDGEIYVYTRKVYNKTENTNNEEVSYIDANLVIDRQFTFMTIDSNNNVEEGWKKDNIMSNRYVCDNYLYTDENKRIDIGSGEEQDIGLSNASYTSYINGIAYTIMNQAEYLKITDLDTLESEEIQIL